MYCKDSRNGRELIKNKNITDYIFARYKDDKWTQTDGKSYKYDKILLSKSFVDMIKEINEPKEILEETKYDIAPDIIHLEEHEKFRNNDGNIVNIEIRGERTVNDIYFKVKDVMIAFEMEKLYDTITDKRKYGYIENDHYKYFNCIISAKDGKKTNKKELYLTYEGILRVLFASHSSKAKTFIKWATETLFTVQLGSADDKQELCASLLGTHIKNVKSVFSTSSDKTPCKKN